MTTIELLEKLTSLAGVAGDEKCSFETFKGLFSPYGNVSCDKVGNIIIEKDGNGSIFCWMLTLIQSALL